MQFVPGDELGEVIESIPLLFLSGWLLGQIKSVIIGMEDVAQLFDQHQSLERLRGCTSYNSNTSHFIGKR